MKKTIFLIMIMLINISILLSAEYCTGTVKRNDGSPEDATVYLYALYNGYWVEVGIEDTNPSTGFYSICLDARPIRWKIVAEVVSGPTLTEFRTLPWGSFEVNFVYLPSNPE